MAKPDYFPDSDNALLAWHKRFKANLATRQAELGVSAEDIAIIDADNDDFHAKITAVNVAAATTRHARAEKLASRNTLENHVRTLIRYIKAHPAYTDAIGDQLGIDDCGHLSPAKPALNARDQTGGVVALNFLKHRSDGINIYCQRECDAEFVFLARDTVPPYIDTRPLLADGKPEWRRYTAVYVQNDMEVGLFSDELVVSCTP